MDRQREIKKSDNNKKKGRKTRRRETEKNKERKRETERKKEIERGGLKHGDPAFRAWDDMTQYECGSH